MPNSMTVSSVLLAASLCLTSGAIAQPADAEPERFTFYANPDDPRSGWRVDQSSGAVSYCEAEALDAPPVCSPWSLAEAIETPLSDAEISSASIAPAPIGSALEGGFSCTFDLAIDGSLPSIEDYYSSARSGSSSALRSELNSIISRDAERLSYGSVWDALAVTDADPCDASQVVLLYSGRTQPVAERAGSGGGQSDRWNREHVWPKSHGFPAARMAPYTDIHHLRPADTTVNSSRGNNDFANGGRPQGEAPNTFRTSTTWEPRDAVKGDVARMMFYMVVRYEGRDRWPDLELVERITRSGEPKLGLVCTLYEWHHRDGVSDWERRRNNLIHRQQGNRNPFIDHPEWVETIWGAQCP